MSDQDHQPERDDEDRAIIEALRGGLPGLIVGPVIEAAVQVYRQADQAQNHQGPFAVLPSELRGELRGLARALSLLTGEQLTTETILAGIEATATRTAWPA